MIMGNKYAYKQQYYIVSFVKSTLCDVLGCDAVQTHR
jgi:hypothetical protein